MPVPRQTRLAIPVLILGAGLTAAFVLQRATGAGGPGVDSLFERGVNNAVLVLAALVILMRGVAVRRERWAWIALGLGLLSWAAGNT